MVVAGGSLFHQLHIAAQRQTADEEQQNEERSERGNCWIATESWATWMVASKQPPQLRWSYVGW